MKNYIDNHNYVFYVFILIAFLFGVQNIDLQLIDDHAWRQSLTSIMSKNLLDHPNLMFPRTVFCCKGDYIIGSEFPIFNAIIASFYKIFGYSFWYGRLVNLIFTTIGVFAFYKIISELFNKNIALYTSAIFLSSIVYLFARKIMPDTFSQALVFISVWFLLQYIKTPKYSYLIPGLIILCLGGLSKFPAFCVLAFMTIPVLENLNNKKLLTGGLGFFIVSLIVAIWYLYWVPYLVDTYGNQLVWPSGLRDGLLQIVNDSQNAWYRVEVNAFSNRIPFFVAIIGLGLALYKRDKNILYVFLIYTILFLGFIAKSGSVFPAHNYYIIPYVPLLSLLFGYAIHNIIPNHKVALVIVSIFFFFGVKDNYEKAKPVDELKSFPRLTALVDQFCSKEDKVMINLGQFNPTGLYFANRFGWSENNDVLAKKEWMVDFKRDGLKLIIVIKAKFPDANLDYKKVYEDQDFIFYEP